MTTPVLSGWLVLTCLMCFVMTWAAYAEPSPLAAKIGMPMVDLFALVGWVQAVVILRQRWIARGR